MTGMMIQQKNQVLITDKIKLKDGQNNDKAKDAFVKYQSMKRSIPTLGIKVDNKSFETGRA